jgi:hypothetical protein
VKFTVELDAVEVNTHGEPIDGSTLITPEFVLTFLREYMFDEDVGFETEHPTDDTSYVYMGFRNVTVTPMIEEEER